MNFRDLLSEPKRKWSAKAPADESKIEELIKAAQLPLPSDYLNLLRVSDGGEGPLALPPLYLQLYSVQDCIEVLHDPSIRNWLEAPQAPNRSESPNFFIFGSNGGLELIAFDLLSGQPWPIVMIDPIAGKDSAERIATDIVTFIQAIGIETEQ